MCVCIYVYMYIYIYIFPGDSDGKESACNVGDPDLICIYMQKKNTINKKKKPQNNGKWALDMPLACLAVLPHCNQGLTRHRALQGLPASLPQFSAPHTSVGLSSEPQKIFYTCLLHCSLLKTLK